MKRGIKIGLFFLLFGLGPGFATDGEPLDVEDIMRFRQIQRPVISDDGAWVSYLSNPDRGDGEAVAIRVRDGKAFRVPQGSKVKVSKDGQWIAVLQKPAAIDVAAAGKNEKKKKALKSSLILINVKTESQETVPRVKDFAFSHNGAWLAIHLELPEPDKKDDSKKDAKKKDKKTKAKGSPLQLRHLAQESKTQIENVARFKFAPENPFLVWVQEDKKGSGNGLYMRSLTNGDGSAKPLLAGDYFKIPKMSFNKNGSALAFLMSPPKLEPEKNDAEATTNEEGESEEEPDVEVASDSEKAKESKPPKSDPRHRVYIWQTQKSQVDELDVNRANWYVAGETSLTWSKDGRRLFFGFKPDFKLDEEKGKPKPFSAENYWNTERILKDRTLDVWHGDDPYIKTFDKTNWKRTSKQDYLAVYHLDGSTWTPLADFQVPSARATDHPSAVLLTSNLAYRRSSTWSGRQRDVWLADLENGDKFKVVEGLVTNTRSSLSPNGQFVVFYRDGNYHLFDRGTGQSRNLTSAFSVPLTNEDHDYPSAVPGYGIAGWLADGSAIMIYDKYDIWVVGLDDAPTYCLTGGDGRSREVVYRIIDTEPDELWYNPGEMLLLSAYFDKEKHSGFYQAQIGQAGVRKLLEDRKTFRFKGKAKDANRLLFTQEDFREFPDLWVARTNLKKAKKLTKENPQIAKFAWGEPELVSWRSADGIPLQGILIKPGNYKPGQRYPVVVYYYRFFSQRMYNFNQMVINHRPNFPLYTSNGYAVFLPDIRFDVGLPGPAAVKCLVPGIQKIVDMGIADPKAIGLHGHSWSGYQTAYVVTQTHIFAAAVSGAPVSNMTSAYSGIRLGSGLARQFQYEMGQSRIGGSLWDKRDLYIENSPVFFADRIQTPMLIQFGDKDEAVPWQQGIELYLAMRRLDKEVVFLQYRGEPHHLKQYPNKLDYTLKMKAYFDHYLKGEPAQSWISDGVPYTGK